MGGDVRELLRVGSGGVDLAGIDPRSTPGVLAGNGKEWGRRELGRIGAELARQQEMLYATARVAPADSVAGRRRVLLVLQGMDCSGKGGTVRNVVGAMNPVGVRVVGFGPPTEQERGQQFGDACEPNRDDFLRRVKRTLPQPGRVGVFDRSHYEDVLVARVHSLVPETTWRGRYEEINRWESELVGGGLVILKVMLHLSYREQAERLAARLDDPTKHWKYNPGDLDERTLWSDYQAAYAEALARCSTEAAPWYVVPADRKWYRDWAVARLLLAAFRELELAYPVAGFDVNVERQRLAAELAGER